MANISDIPASSSTVAATRSKCQKTLHDTVYTEQCELPIGKLPVQKDVVCCMLYLLRPDRAGKAIRTINEAALLLSNALVEHWHFCNVYTIGERHIVKKICGVYNEFKNNCQTRTNRKTDMWKERMSKYNHQLKSTLFDISTQDRQRTHNLEEQYGVKMTSLEYDFLEDQKGPRIGYCTSFVDRKWEKTTQRRQKDQLSYERMKKNEECSCPKAIPWKKVPSDLQPGDSTASSEGDTDEATNEGPGMISDSDGDIPRPRKMRRISDVMEAPSDKLPEEFRHIRHTIKQVKPEFYTTVDKLISTNHCSKNQAVSAVITVANEMFGRQWKHHNEDSASIDVDTAPSSKSIRETGRAIETYTLKCIVDEIMASDEAVITYHDDGSRKKGVGSFMVQGVTINGKFRAFPTLPIASESMENLTQLKLAILNILATCSGVDPKDLFEKINFRMMDSTAHNFGVDEQVSIDLGTDHVPDELLCSTHPVLMFNRAIIDIFQTIESAVGKDKLYAKVMVNATTTHDTVTEQFLDVMMRFISKDFDHKPWNYAQQFGTHIAPKKNEAVQLKKERFNRFAYACACAVYHVEDLWTFLDKYEHVTNNLACVLRAFQDVDCLVTFLLAAAILGVHLIEPFLALTYSGNVTYRELIPAMQKLYENLTTTTDMGKLLDLSKPAFDFVNERQFKLRLWPKQVLDALSLAIEQNKPELLKIFKLMLPKLAEGWLRQRGEVFGFGDFDQESPRLLLNIDPDILDKAQINNMAAERQVGRINYELKIRGSKGLKVASSSNVKAQSYELVELDSTILREHRKISNKTNELMKSWIDQQNQLTCAGVTKKETENLKIDKRRNSDLSKLRDMGGPFVSAPEVDLYMAREDVTPKEKDTRLYLEVRYARDSCLSLPKSSDIFRLKRAYKNLSVDEYSTNLKIYFDKVETNASATRMDFLAALEKLTQ